MTKHSDAETPLDGSAVAIGFSKETVTPGEVESMCIAANSLLSGHARRAPVNGVPARVTDLYTKVTIGEDLYHARVGEFLEKPIASSAENLPFILFDETPDTTVQTPNMVAVRFERIGSNIVLITDNELTPSVNDPHQVALVKKILSKLTERADAQTASLHEKKKIKREQRVNYIVEGAGRIARVGAGVGLSVAILAGVFIGLKKVDWSELADGPGTPFDKKDLTLPSGAVISLGESGSPEYSTELFASSDLSIDEVPVAEYDTGSSNYDDTEVLNLDGNLRQIKLYSSKDGKNCEEAPVEKVSSNSEIIAWTDFTNPDGTTRADELEVKYTVENVEVCWNGQEIDEQDDPRVVLLLREPK